MKPKSLTVVLVVDGPTRLAAPILAERFPHVRAASGAVLVGLERRETPESVLSFCRERRIGVLASCVVSRTVAPPQPSSQGVC